MTITDVYNKYKGQSVDVDGVESDRGQCFQWFDIVLNELYGLPYLYASGAINIWEDNGSYSLKPYFDFIPYSPTMPIKAGDIVVYGTGVGSPYGHVSIALQDGQGNNYQGADTNWGHNLTVHQTPHNDSYNQYILGVLRFKGTVQEEPMIDQNHLNALTMAYFNRGPNAQENAQWLNKATYPQVIEAFDASAEYKTKQQADWQNASGVSAQKLAQIKTIVEG